MRIGLLDPLRHNSWATRELLAFCRTLSPDQLEATAVGTYGSIFATLEHMVQSEAGYRFRLSSRRPVWPRDPEPAADLDDLARIADHTARLWEELAGGDFDPEQVIGWVSPVSGADTEVRAGILVAQALNHGNEHRSQIATILTTIGVEPPSLDGWSYAIATGRFHETPPGSG